MPWSLLLKGLESVYRRHHPSLCFLFVSNSQVQPQTPYTQVLHVYSPILFPSVNDQWCFNIGSLRLLGGDIVLFEDIFSFSISHGYVMGVLRLLSHIQVQVRKIRAKY